ncbi:MAG: TRAP transporter permease, partial [Firmicutes bacterium]|nr:TRAP transporter permease [Bacillota bacterium]
MFSRKKDEDKTIVNSAPVDVDDANRDIAAEVDAMMKKFDLESNTRIWEGWQKWVVMTISACFAAYCIWSTLFSVAGIEERLTAFLGCIIVLGYLNYPMNKKRVRVNALPWYDILLMVAGASAFFYYCVEYKNLVMVLTSASKMNFWFTAVGVVGVLSLMELCRRCVGLPILCVVGGLLVYTFSIGLSLERVIYTL